MAECLMVGREGLKGSGWAQGKTSILMPSNQTCKLGMHMATPDQKHPKHNGEMSPHTGLADTSNHCCGEASLISAGSTKKMSAASKEKLQRCVTDIEFCESILSAISEAGKKRQLITHDKHRFTAEEQCLIDQLESRRDGLSSLKRRLDMLGK